MLEIKLDKESIESISKNLAAVFKEIIKDELTASKQTDAYERFLSPKDTCMLFVPNITLPTLESYVQKGLLKKYYLGGRTWFIYSELLDAIKDMKNYTAADFIRFHPRNGTAQVNDTTHN